ncbi:hypothetical protein NDU88_003387 [Pleurodeles waltl]|uniref:Uncharacterized protein n=1 Tax=Pleurodeles waltl TaxID=8319 RepID=A0AAV7W286_PLEWA|nr:hypothetical protein NDU88_003387 [Pleurodeles waltl]
MSSAVSPTNTEVQALRSGISSFQVRLRTVERQQMDEKSHLDAIPDWTKDICYLQQKIVNLEECSCRDNIRIIGLPEAFEKDNMLHFVGVLIPDLLNLTYDPPLNLKRAHRIHLNLTPDDHHPRYVLEY